MRIVITGSSGQVGTNLALRCMEKGYQVTGVDCRENTWTDKIATKVLDLRKPVPTDFHMDDKRPDIVVHLAAHAKVHELVEHPQLALENITMTSNILEYCRLNKFPIVFSSSREVYGNLKRDTTREYDADFTKITSSYTASKISGEALIYSYARCYELSYIVFRLSNVYGRYDTDLERMERVIPLFKRLIQNDEVVTVFGPEKVLDFTYIDDCVDGLLSGIERLSDGRVKNTTINLAYCEGHTLTNMAEYLGECLDRVPKINLQPSRVGEVTHYVANIDKARELLDFCPKVQLREGIKHVVECSLESFKEDK